MEAADQITEANRLIEARTKQLLAAASIREVLMQALDDIKARVNKAMEDAEAIRKDAEKDVT